MKRKDFVRGQYAGPVGGLGVDNTGVVPVSPEQEEIDLLRDFLDDVRERILTAIRQWPEDALMPLAEWVDKYDAIRLTNPR